MSIGSKSQEEHFPEVECIHRTQTYSTVPNVPYCTLKLALWESASVISMGDSAKVPFFQDVLEFGTRRQLELFTIIGKIAIIQDVLEFGTTPTRAPRVTCTIDT